MMTTNLFVIANVKQLRTGCRFRFLLPFFRTSWSVCVLNSAIFNGFHNRVEFGTIFEGLRNFGGMNTPTHPRYATDGIQLFSCIAFNHNGRAERWNSKWIPSALKESSTSCRNTVTCLTNTDGYIYDKPLHLIQTFHTRVVNSTSTTK